MSNFERRVERDLQEISEHAPSTTDAWTAIRDRIERDGTDAIPETIMLDTDTDTDSATRRRLWPILAGAAVLLVVALAVALSVGSDSDEVDTVEDPTVETTQPPDEDEFPVSEVDGLSALEVDGTFFQMNEAGCALEERAVSGGTELLKALAEGSTDDGQRYGALLTRTRLEDGTEIDKVRLTTTDPAVDGKLGELQFTAEGEALFEVNGDLLQTADLVATSPDGSESITASFTIAC